MRPSDILMEWECTELIVAYAKYMNEESARWFASLDKKDMAKMKVKPSDKWAIPFISLDDLPKVIKRSETEQKKIDEDQEKFGLFQ